MAALAKLYNAAPELVEALSECYYVTAAGGTSIRDALCTVKAAWGWLVGGAT